jgi:hypothetical protein
MYANAHVNGRYVGKALKTKSVEIGRLRLSELLEKEQRLRPARNDGAPATIGGLLDSYRATVESMPIRLLDKLRVS